MTKVFEIDKKWDFLLMQNLCFKCESRLTILENSKTKLVRLCKVCGVLVNDTKEVDKKK